MADQGEIYGQGRLGGNGAFAVPLLDPDIDVPGGVTDYNGAHAPKRYGVYRNNVVVSLMEALKSAYPSLLVIMGETNFNTVARNFIDTSPPRSAMMQDYGRGFAEFLDAFPPLRKSRFLGDVARVERAWLEAYHAADAPTLTASDLEDVDPDSVMQLRLVPHPAAFLISSRWPVADLFGWRNGKPSQGADLETAQCVAIARPALSVVVNETDLPLHQFLVTLANGADLGEAAGAALECDEAFDLSRGLAYVLSSGLFSQRKRESE